MSFWKSVLNVINPLPSIVKANKVEGQSFGSKLMNLVNPAGAMIKENSGLTDLQLSPEYKEMVLGTSSAGSTDKANSLMSTLISKVKTQSVSSSAEIPVIIPEDLGVTPENNQSSGNGLLIVGGLVLLVFLVMQKR